jgi:hypothetical protein
MRTLQTLFKFGIGMLIVAAILFCVLIVTSVFFGGPKEVEAATDPLKADAEILIDQYASAASYHSEQKFLKNFHNYMIGSDRLEKAADLERKHYQPFYKVTIKAFSVGTLKVGDVKDHFVTIAIYEVKSKDTLIGKGTLTSTYKMEGPKLKLIMAKFSDEVIKWNDHDATLNQEPKETPKPRLKTPNLKFEQPIERQI